MWDERFSTKEYAYGTKPNDFLKENFKALPKGKLLSLGEGEGRNAVFLARMGYQVTAVDYSSVGLNKGRRLAQKHGVDIEFIHADITEFDLGENRWSSIISIFFPLPPAQRAKLYQKVTRALTQDGIFLMEAYTPEQLHNDTGGGKSPELMQSIESLKAELPGLEYEHLETLKRDVVEGLYHTGRSAVLQVIARRR